MFLLTSVYKILVCALAFIIVVVLMLLSAKFFWHFYLADPPHMLISLLRNLNSQFSSGRLEDIQAWIQKAEWLQEDTRAYVAGLFHIRVRVTGMETLGIAEIIPNLLGMASFGAFVSFVPLLFLTIAILQIASLPTAQLGAWALVALLLAAPLGLIFSAFGLVAAFACWVVFLFNDMAFEYLVSWLLLGLPALGLGIAAGMGLMAVPFALAAGADATGLVADVRNRLLAFPASLYRSVMGVIAWLHYFFVPHPAEAPVNAGRRRGANGKIDLEAVAEATNCGDFNGLDPRDMPQAYQSENQRKKAEALHKKAEADSALFDELEARERARRRMEKAKRGEG